MIKPERSIRSTNLAVRLLIGSAVIFMLAGCATTVSPPSEQLQAAEFAINTAEQERAGDHAPQDLRQARDKLRDARAAVEAQDMVLATRLADEARVSAELATAKSELMQARAINEEMESNITTLEQEMLRNSGSN